MCGWLRLIITHSTISRNTSTQKRTAKFMIGGATLAQLNVLKGKVCGKHVVKKVRVKRMIIAT